MKSKYIMLTIIIQIFVQFTNPFPVCSIGASTELSSTESKYITSRSNDRKSTESAYTENTSIKKANAEKVNVENANAANSNAANSNAANSNAENANAANANSENTNAENTNAENTNAENANAENVNEESVFMVYSGYISSKGKPPSLSAHSAVVMEYESKRILFSKNLMEKLPMASTTKIMTAIVAIENGNKNDIVKISKSAASIGGSSMKLKEGDLVRLGELLEGLLLKSGNDAAVAIAQHIGGDMDTFINMMNRKAYILGARNSSFKTPHGLDVVGHYSTAYDLAIIAAYAMSLPDFSSIVSRKDINQGSRNLHNTNELLSSYQGADGIKTGYTGKAGRCLVASATRDNMKCISVVLGCPTKKARANDSIKLLDYAFSNYKKHLLAEKGVNAGEIKVSHGQINKCGICITGNFIYPLKDDEIKKVKKLVIMPREIKAPVAVAENIGKLSIMLGEDKIVDIALATMQDVKEKDFGFFFIKMIKYWLGTES